MLRRLIYFPRKTELGRDPRIIWSDGELSFSREYYGSDSEKDWEMGKKKRYDGGRCRSYSDRLWQECIEWTARREQLEKDFINMMTMISK